MISIKKPDPPKVLREKGAPETKRLCEAFASGTKEFIFDRDIYAAKEVKEALRKAQHDKCAFCESKVSHISFGDVEHFRPKASYRQKKDGKLRRPGYYWLAYEWRNLLFSCELCNRRFKCCLFPLKNPRRRAYSHRHKLENEEPLFIDPSVRDPSEFITFRKDEAYPVNGCREGKTTIEALGLNRAELIERRRDLFALIEMLVLLREELRWQAANDPSPVWLNQLEDADRRLKARSESHAEYAGMVRAYLAGLKA